MQIGQHVVYIGYGLGKISKPLTPGKVYTVRELYVARDGMPCLTVAEVVNRINQETGQEIGYRRDKFRPLSPKRLEQFTQFLTTKPEKVEA